MRIFINTPAIDSKKKLSSFKVKVLKFFFGSNAVSIKN